MEVNGRKLKIFRGREWQVIDEALRGSQVIELGMESQPLAPVAFPSSWGKGILISAIKGMW